MGSSGLTKMTLTGFNDPEYKNKIDTYTALINPESYAISYATELNSTNAQGSSQATTKTNKRAEQTLRFKFLFDGTGVIQNSSDNPLSGLAIPGLPTTKPSVVDDIAKFKKVTYDYISGTHDVPYIQLQWGLLHYNCRLTSMTLTFKLFTPDGTPLRAEADCNFTGSITNKELAAHEDKQSPDLTHIKTVKAGDTLPLLCYREYGDSKYYFEVAKFNKLTDIKILTPGMKISFPPLN